MISLLFASEGSLYMDCHRSSQSVNASSFHARNETASTTVGCTISLSGNTPLLMHASECGGMGLSDRGQVCEDV